MATRKRRKVPAHEPLPCSPEELAELVRQGLEEARSKEGMTREQFEERLRGVFSSGGGETDG
jgi:hypothetical protein